MIFSLKHQSILNTAETLFAENSYEATTVRDIADTGGINLAMISYSKHS